MTLDPNLPNLATRSDAQAEKIILNRILSGEYREGMRLPNTVVLAAQLNIGVNSVQQALARLSTLGYLERRPRMGTIVRAPEKKPLHVLILVGPDLKREPHHMDRRLTSCLENELTAAGYIPHVHDNLTTLHAQGGAARAHMVSRLIQDFTLHDPVGVIESSAVFKRIWELSSEFGRPSVAIKSPHTGGDVSSDRAHFMTAALERLVAAGCKRLLWATKVTGSYPDSLRLERFWDALTAFPLECVRIIEVNDQDPAENPEAMVCEQMKSFIRQNRALPLSKRADCALVDEDILMRGISLALLSEQVKIPEELTICSLTNEGVDLHFGVPVIVYENPISEIARQSVGLLTARILRKGEARTPILIPGRIDERCYLPIST